MVGELDVTIADQNATIEFLGNQILFRFQDYATAWSISNRPLPSPSIVGKLLSFGELKLRAQIGKRKPIDLFPQAGWIVRMLSPAIREMGKSTKP
ncbi:MAG: hypothetical protein ACI87E_002258 [Mariniblastus sp.]